MATPTTTLSALNLLTPVLPVGTTVLSTDSSTLPFIINADLNTTRIEIGIYNTVYGLDTFTVVGANNQFNTNVLITNDPTNVQIVGRNYDPNVSWQPNFTYTIPARFADPNGNVQVLVTAGVSSAIQPSWSTLTPVAATSVTVFGDLLTVQASNNFSPGQLVYFTAFQNATFLNGQTVTIITASPIAFTAALTQGNYSTTLDIGIVQAATADNGAEWVNIGTIAVTPIVKFALIHYQSDLAVAIAPPSGISALKNQTDCTLQWVTPDYPGFIGVRVQISTDPAGINPPFTQFGDLITTVTSSTQTLISTTSNTSVNVPTALITNVGLTNNLLTVIATNSFVQGTVVEITNLLNATFLNGETLTVLAATPTQFTAAFTGENYSATADSGTATSVISTSTTTNVNIQMVTDYSTVDVPFSAVNTNIFYAMFSTLIQDPNTNIVYESVENGPLLCGFVNLKVAAPTDFPVLQRKEDIAGRLIAQINKQLPDLDLSPRSEVRDIFIDPFSIELANMSVREWFARVATSISAISQVDNASGNGISDPFQSSPYKQQIARAYGLSPADTQNLINEQFDLLGEVAGLSRLGASTATVVVTFYTFQQPQSSITIPEGAIISTVPDSNTSSLNFITQGSGTIDISNLASFFNTNTGWWGISVPAQCQQAGSIGNVGAGTIRQTVSGTPAGISVTNQVGAQFGTDQESNSAFAARIQARTVTGVDGSSRHGYLVAALSTPGIIGAQVVAAGDLFMLRDWDPTRQKHVFGAVDIYVRGTTLSQQDNFVPFSYTTNGTYAISSTYSTLNYLGGNKFQIAGFSALAFPPYDGVELLVSRSGSSFYLSLDRAQFDEVAGNIIVNTNDIAYQYVGSGATTAKIALLLNGNPATNQAALAAISGATINTYSFQLFLREESPFTFTPSFQPVLQVYSVTGSATETGAIPSNDVELIHTSDFLLNGGSNNAGDFVQVNLTSTPTTATLNIPTLTSPTLIDIGMNQPLDSNGNPLDVLSVRSTDLGTLYEFGVDYSIVAIGPYHQYAIQPLTSSVGLTTLQITNNILTVIAPNEFGVGAPITFSAIADPSFAAILNGQTVVVGTATSSQFTATFVNPNLGPTSTTGFATGSAIQTGQSVSITYNKFILYERLSFISDELQVLSGTLPTTLDNDGFVQNTWLPESYTVGIPSLATYPGQLGFSLTLDGWNGNYNITDGGLDLAGSFTFDPSGLVGNAVQKTARYIKVTYFNGVVAVVMKEGLDFTLTVDPTSRSATLARILTGRIPDGGTVSVSYFVTETFTVSTQYPTFVEMLANTIAQSKSAAADVLIKAEVANPVDITLSVTLEPNTSPATVDPVIRTAINIVLDNSVGTLFQSVLVQQIQNITGVQSVEVPLIKCAKSDGSYDIGVVIPTGTSWTRLTADPAFNGITVPANSWITTSPVLPDSTIPSGGETNAIVDMLYQGQVFERSTSLQNFLSDPLTVAHLAVAPGVVFDAPGSFYIIGTNDTLTSAATANLNSVNIAPSTYWRKIVVTIPADVPNPGNLSYFVTYQVFNEGGATDVTVSPTEYLTPGTITINYVTAS